MHHPALLVHKAMEEIGVMENVNGMDGMDIAMRNQRNERNIHFIPFGFFIFFTFFSFLKNSFPFFFLIKVMYLSISFIFI